MKDLKKEVSAKLSKAIVSAVLYLGSTFLKELGKVLICESKEIANKSKIDIAKIEAAYSEVADAEETTKA